MIEKFYELSTFWRIALLSVIGVAIMGFIYFGINQGSDEPEETDGGVGVVEPTNPTDPTTEPPTEEPPVEEPEPTEEPPVEEPIDDVPVASPNDIPELPTITSETALSFEDQDAAELAALAGIPEIYKLLPDESQEARAERLAPFADLSSPNLGSLQEWAELSALGFEMRARVDTADHIGGTTEDYRLMLGLTIYSTNVNTTGSSGNQQVAEEAGIYQVALKKVNDAWIIWAIEQTS